MTPGAARWPGQLRAVARRARSAAACALVALATGCATVAPAVRAPGADDGPVAGRFALTLAEPGAAPRRSQARFETEGDDRTGRLAVLSPVGTTMAEARWSPAEVTLATADGQRRFDSLEALSQDLLGERLPLQALVHWLRGRPWPGAPHQPRADGVAGFDQLGWRIDLTALHTGGLTMARPAPPASVDLRVRIDPATP